MAYFPHAYSKTLLASHATPFMDGDAATDNGLDIAAGQIGIVDAATGLVQDLDATPSYANIKMVYLAQGSFYAGDKVGPHHGGYQETVKTKGINPKYVSEFYKVEASNPHNAITTVDSGVDCTEIACDTTYYLRLDVKGSPALRHLTHNAYINAPGFSGCCDDSNSNIDPAVVFLGWADYINDHAPISPFVNVTALVDINATAAEAATATAAQALDFTSAAPAGLAVGDRVEFTASTASTTPDGTITGYVFDVATGATNSIFSVGQVLSGTGVVAGTKIVKLLTGGGGAGSTFEVDTFQNVTATAITGTGAIVAYVKAAADPMTLYAAETLTTGTTTDIDAFTTTSVTPIIWQAVDSATYTPLVGAAADTNRVKLEIVGAYVETKFGDCSFDPKDHYELEPVSIYASIVDESGNPCNTTCFSVTDTQAAAQGKGFGESIIRDMILFKRYRQEDFKTDPRLREVLGETVLDDISRTGKYSCYYILHSVPRKSNPSGVMDNDQYLVKVAIPDTGAAGVDFDHATVGKFETWMEALLASAGNPITCQSLL
jgi:hypothetical protein